MIIMASELQSRAQVCHYLSFYILCGQITSSAHLFELHRIPLLYVYSDADEVIDSALSAEFAKMFGARHSDSTDCQPVDLAQKAGNY